MKYRSLVMFVLATMLLGACGAPSASTETNTPSPAAESSPSPETSPAAESSPSPESSPAAAGAFPVTIEHKFGSTEIPAQPERVVSLGYNDQDPLLALGVQPVAVRYWFGDQPYAVWPWAQDELGDAEPEVLNMPFGELNFEAIAALQPDLIVAVSAGITEAEFQTLSEIAPTVAQSDAYVDFGVPWQEQTQVIGQAIGQEARARELVGEMEERFAEVRAEHPEFAGATAAIAAPSSDGQYFFSGPEHERQRFLTSLGFELPDELVEIAGDAFYGTISGERLALLDTDVLLWTVSAEEQAAIEADPLYQQLEVAQQGRAIFLDTTGEGDLVGPALVFSSVLSLPVVFDELVPQLAAAIGTSDSTPEATPAADADSSKRSVSDANGSRLDAPIESLNVAMRRDLINVEQSFTDRSVSAAAANMLERC